MRHRESGFSHLGVRAGRKSCVPLLLSVPLLSLCWCPGAYQINVQSSSLPADISIESCLYCDSLSGSNPVDPQVSVWVLEVHLDICNPVNNLLLGFEDYNALIVQVLIPSCIPVMCLSIAFFNVASC